MYEYLRSINAVVLKLHEDFDTPGQLLTSVDFAILCFTSTGYSKEGGTPPCFLHDFISNANVV